MVNLELYRTEGLGDEINKKAGVTAASVYKFPANFEIIIELEVDESKDAVFKSYFENERTKEKVHDACIHPKSLGLKAKNKLVNDYSGGIANLNDFAAAGRLDEADDAYNKLFTAALFQQHVQNVSDEMEKDIEAYWDARRKEHREYKAYKLKMAGKIGFTSAGIALNVGVNAVVIATSGFHFGAGTVLSIIGLSKSIITLADIAIDLLKGVDTAVNEAINVFATVLNDHNKKNDGKAWKHFGNAKQFTETMINQAVTDLLALPKFFDTLDKAKEKLSLAESKLAGSGVALDKLGKKITKTKNRIAALETRINQAAIQAKDLRTPKEMKLDMKKLVKTKRQLEILEAKISSKDDLYLQRQAALMNVREGIKQVSKDHKITEASRRGLSILLLGLQTAASIATMDFTSLMSVGATVADIGLTVTSAAYEKAVDLYAGQESAERSA